MSPGRTALLPLAALLLPACAPDVDLVVYVAHDQFHSEPLVRRFEEETGLRVRAEYDVEASKTVGLVNRIRQEKNRTRCDVFWNNEVAHTVALAGEGLLQPYDSPSAADVPSTFRDPEARWTGFGARARVFIVNTELVPPEERATLTTIRDLVDPRWAGRCGMARPLTGTTLTHAAALFDLWGEEEALAFLGALKARNDEGALHLLSGNGHVMRQVRDGALAWGLTDTDDFNVARLEGKPVAVVYPDQETGGTFLLPNTVAILADAPHPAAARRFVDWLLSEEVEAELARSRAAQIPVRAAVPRPEHVIGGERLRFAEVDYLALGRALVERQELLKEMFLD
jgi:iron(III) transport system substrate-binding protein